MTTRDTLTIKHLCQEYKLDPRLARKLVRGILGARGKRWVWKSTDPELKKVRKALEKHNGKTSNA